MSNVGFLRQDWPAIHADCLRAESYLASDPRGLHDARRAVDEVVGHIYAVDALPLPYRDDLAGRIAEPGFTNKVPSASPPS